MSSYAQTLDPCMVPLEHVEVSSLVHLSNTYKAVIQNLSRQFQLLCLSYELM